MKVWRKAYLNQGVNVKDEFSLAKVDAKVFVRSLHANGRIQTVALEIAKRRTCDDKLVTSLQGNYEGELPACGRKTE